MQHGQGVPAGERRPAREHFVQDDPGRVEIGGQRRGVMVGDLRRHVFGCPDHGAQPGQRPAVGQAGDAEVGQLDVRLVTAGVDQQVLWLDVPVHDSGLVHRGQAVEELTAVAGGFGRRQRALGRELAPQVQAVNQFHDDGERLTLDDQVDDASHVRMRGREQDRAFAEKPGDDVGIGEQLRLEQLHRHRRAVLPDAAAEYLAHAAAADLLADRVFAAQQLVHGLPSPHQPFSARNAADVIARALNWLFSNKMPRQDTLIQEGERRRQLLPGRLARVNHAAGGGRAQNFLLIYCFFRPGHRSRRWPARTGPRTGGRRRRRRRAARSDCPARRSRRAP